MRRFIFHLLIAMTTFSIGIIVMRVSTSDHRALHTSEAQNVKLATLKTPEPSVPSNPAQAAAELVCDYNPEEFNPRGDYYILGRKPKDFQEFDNFELAVEANQGVASGVGRFETRSNQMYNGSYTVSGVVNKTRLTFVATPLSAEDYVYSFDGRFLKEGVLADPFKARVVLEGKLIKSKGCVKMAECQVKFRVEYLGC